MSPAQFLARLGQTPAGVLFLGAEAYERSRCREALIQARLGSERGGGALSRYDASEISLHEVLDDAKTMSLFASERVITVIGCEAWLPRSSRASPADEDASDDEGGSAPAGAEQIVAQYFQSPSPGVTLLFEATRFDLEGEDKRKADRARKLFEKVPAVVEFKRLTADEARMELAAMAKRLGFSIDAAASAMLVDALGADMGRIATEAEKLALYAGARPITTDDIVALIPDARVSTIFNLVNALGRSDRRRALASLDALVRENEYLPLALSFLSTQFRQALAARRANLRSAQQVQSYFSKNGVAMWGQRAEQVAQTAQLSEDQLEQGLKFLFEADRDLRSARPDDRIVMEQLIVRLTA